MLAEAKMEGVDSYNETLVNQYVGETKRGLTERRKNKIRFTLNKLGREFLKKPLDSVSKDDLEEFLDDLREDDEFADSTKVTYRKILKPFFKWLHQDEPDFSTWIRTGQYGATVSPEDVLTADERSRLVEICTLKPRDIAMFAALYESAARPKEFMALWKHDVTFEQNGPATMHIEKGKTGRPRDILLFQDAGPLLHKWIFNDHPLRAQDDFPLWVDMSRGSQHDALVQQGLRKWMDRIVEAAHIKKRVVPYTLRHSRLTDLARDGASEALLSEIAGWQPGSKMPAVYIHLSKRDQRPMMEKLLGLSRPVAEVEKRQPKICQNCRTSNTFDSQVCHMCGMAVDTKSAIQMIKARDEQLEEMQVQLTKAVERGDRAVEYAQKTNANVEQFMREFRASQTKDSKRLPDVRPSQDAGESDISS